MMKVLLAGWFSFEQMGATAGDLMVREVVARWLADNGIAYDLAVAQPFTGGVDWRTVDPASYSHVVFACGPFGNGEPITEFLKRFAGRKLVGLNLSMLQRLDEWNPFDLLIERDSSRRANPDLAFASAQEKVPIVGVILVHRQNEYKKGMHAEVNAAITKLVGSRESSIVQIDTRLDVNATGLRTPREIESLIARMDVVVTTRLHGTVLAIKNSVPPVVVDPIAGGAKVASQARAIGWPIVLTADEVTGEKLGQAFEYCLTEAARVEAAKCNQRARQAIDVMRAEFLAKIADWKRAAAD